MNIFKSSNRRVPNKKSNSWRSDYFLEWKWAKKVIVLDKDISKYGLFQLENTAIEDVNKIGGKASNFAEILKAFKRENKIAPVPENYFVIPFYYYDQHLKK